jgi:hypothetical protein
LHIFSFRRLAPHDASAASLNHDDERFVVRRHGGSGVEHGLEPASSVVSDGYALLRQ